MSVGGSATHLEDLFSKKQKQKKNGSFGNTPPEDPGTHLGRSDFREQKRKTSINSK